MLSFGKYKNVTLADIHKKDEKYLLWLNTQPWFVIKFEDLHNQTTKLLNTTIKSPVINEKSFIIYTDGSCPENGTKKARGGIGIHFSPHNKIKLEDISIKLDIDNPTNNKTELMAIERALEVCIMNNITKQIILYTDSQYSLKCITLWYPEWVRKNKLQGKKNVDILQRIDVLMKQVSIQFEHIKAHTGLKDEHSRGNYIADSLATGCM